MAFLLMLSLTLSVFVAIEVQQAGATRLNQEARQNALLGLQIAISQLQEAAGPDRRVTAFADILPSVDSSKRHWTGVWRTDQEDAPPVWLVSGNVSNVSTPVSGETIVMKRGAAGAYEDVKVPLEELEGDMPLGVRNRFGYWVVDQGVMASVAPGRSFSSTDDRLPRVAVEQIRGLEFIDNDVIPELKNVFSVQQLALLSDQDRDLTARLIGNERFFDLTQSSMGVLSDARKGGLKIDLSRGLEQGAVQPSGTVFNNGPSWNLVRDFYNRFRVAPENPVMLVYPRRPDISSTSNGWTVPGYPKNNGRWPAEHGIFPIIVYSELSFGMIAEQYDDKRVGVLTLGPVIALANPYNVSLARARYVVRFHSYNENQAGSGQRNPCVAIAFNGQWLRDGENYTSLHLNKLLSGYDPNNWRSNDLRFEIEAEFAPGEIKWFSLPEGAHADDYYETGKPVLLVSGTDFQLSEFIRVLPSDEQDPDLTLPDEPVVSVSLTFPTVFSEVILYLKQDPNGPVEFHDAYDDPDYNRLQEVSSIFMPITSRKDADITSGSAEKMVYMFQHIKGSSHSGTNRSWEGIKGLSQFNVRSSIHRPANPDNSNLHFRSAPHYAAYTDIQQAFNEMNLWEPEGIIGSVAGDPRYAMILFHVPRENEAFYSVADLQHVDFSMNSYAPSYQVGNAFAHPFIPAGSTTAADNGRSWMDLSWHLNDALWDRYFFSTIRLEADDGGGLQIEQSNERMVVYDRENPALKDNLADPEKAASHLMLEGAFNINSTSVEAWKALLSGRHGSPVTYRDYTNPASPEGETVSYPATPGKIPISRLPVPGGSPDVGDDFWRGFRVIEGRIADNAISDETMVDLLAKYIVAEIRRRAGDSGKPFLSLADFVNRRPRNDTGLNSMARYGTIQQALESLRADYPSLNLNPAGKSNQRFFPGLPLIVNYAFEGMVTQTSGGFRGEGAPGFITQADILNVIGPFIAVRSDTFVIRAYGDVISRLDGSTIAQAWCEAVVQRLPDYVDPSDPPYLTENELKEINQRLGRRFVIKEFRWLQSDEL